MQPRQWSLGFAWLELRGTPVPAVDDYDVRHWDGARTFALHGRQGLFTALFWLLVVGFGEASATSAPTPAGIIAAGAVAWSGQFAYWLTYGGRVVIDPKAGEIVWLRPWRSPESNRRWRFEEISKARGRRGPCSFRMRLRFESGTVLVRVPSSGQPIVLARSLMAWQPESGALETS